MRIGCFFDAHGGNKLAHVNAGRVSCLNPCGTYHAYGIGTTAHLTDNFQAVFYGRNAGIEFPSRCVVKGDSLCADIAAASVLAKVSRDRYMLQMDELYPQYHFRQHKGYGTKLHYEALREYGPSPIHRLSFLRKMH